MKILIVENEAIQGETLERVLTLKGHQCDWAANGEAALSRLAVHAYDGLIVDQMMPGMSGMELVRLVRATPGCADVPVALVTGLAEEKLDGLREEAAALGVAFVGKPYTLPEIEAALKGGGGAS